MDGQVIIPVNKYQTPITKELLARYPDDVSERARVRKLSAEFNRLFRENFGCVRCLDLKKNGQPCAKLIEYAAEKAENLIQENL